MTEQTAVPRLTRREELVQIALAVLERDGFAHLSIGEVARRAGIKPPSLYKQFESKADIEVSLIAHGLDLLAEAFAHCRDEMPADLARRERVARLMQCFRDFGLAHPQLYLLMNSRRHPEEHLGPVSSHAAARMFWEMLDGGDDGEFVSSVFAWAHGILSLEIVGRVTAPDAAWRMLVDTVDARTSAVR